MNWKKFSDEMLSRDMVSGGGRNPDDRSHVRRRTTVQDKLGDLYANV